jgi:23S rRNA pseudouridine1911/1915/1917 synthase
MSAAPSRPNRADADDLIRLSREWRITTLYEDRALLAINKPAGLIAAPESWSRTRRNLMLYLQEGVRRHAYWAVSRGIRWIQNVHRLDADTSGILLLAKNPLTLRRMTELWELRQVAKEYLALVEGAPREDAFEISRGIAPHPKRQGMMVLDDRHGKPSKTSVSALERFPHHTLLLVKPLTGRTHQIRIHLASVGLPIASDPLYGSGRPAPMKRLGLHAARLRFAQPFTGQPVDIQAPWPEDLIRAMELLRRGHPTKAGDAPGIAGRQQRPGP